MRPAPDQKPARSVDPPHRRRFSCLAALALLLAGLPAAEAQSRTWAEEKCARYESAFNDLLDMVGRAGVTGEFIAGNKAFIAAGCSNGADVCPTSEKDFDLANKLTIAAMGFEAASTFLPFICRN